jgi:O-antigen/teichoic acid export membrane protein
MPDTTAATPKPSVIQSAFRGSIVYAVPMIGQRVAGILILSVVTRVLTPADFGMMALLEQVYSILSLLFGGQFTSGLGYFYFQKDSEEHRARVLGTALAGAFALGSIAALVCVPFSRLIAIHVFRNIEAQRYLPLIILGMPFGFLLEALFGWLRVADRQRAFALASLLRVLGTAAGIGVLVGIFKLRVIAYVASWLAVILGLCVALVVYVLRTIRLSWASEVFWGMLRFSAPMALSWVAMFVINFGDQFVLPQYRPLGEVGVYSLAYRIGMLVNVAIASFFTYWNAQVYQIMRREDAEPIFARFLTYCLVLVSGCSLLLVLGARPGLRILVAPAFQQAAAIAPLIVAANAIRAISEFVRTRFLADGLPRMETYCTWIGLAVCVPSYFLLIPRYGMWGAGAATFLTLFVMGVLSFVWTYRIRAYQLELSRLMKLGGITLAIVVVSYVVPVSSLFAQIAWSALLFCALPAGLWLLKFLTPEELSGVRSILSRVAGRVAEPARSI